VETPCTTAVCAIIGMTTSLAGLRWSFDGGESAMCEGGNSMSRIDSLSPSDYSSHASRSLQAANSVESLLSDV